MRSLNVMLVGEEGAGAGVLKALSRSGHRVLGVVTSRPKEPVLGTTPWHVAQQLGYETLPKEQVKDPRFAGVLREQNTDLLLNVHSLLMIRPEVLQAPRLGSFNLHPGPLPRYAGRNAPSWAIFRGERSHGVTIHHMAAGIDTGPIAYQSLFPIEENDTGFSLSARCVQVGLQLMEKLLETAAQDRDAIPQIPQDLSQREYFGNGVPYGGCLSWARPAREILDFVRACDYSPFPSPWGHPRTWQGTRELEIVKATAAEENAQATPGTATGADGPCVRIACADKEVWVHKVRVAGQHRQASDVLHVGDRLHGTSDEAEVCSK